MWASNSCQSIRAVGPDHRLAFLWLLCCDCLVSWSLQQWRSNWADCGVNVRRRWTYLLFTYNSPSLLLITLVTIQRICYCRGTHQHVSMRWIAKRIFYIYISVNIHYLILILFYKISKCCWQSNECFKNTFCGLPKSW